MKLKELTMTNFMPYRGEQRVKFPSAAARNVMVVFGDNMRGKTSFLNAIRWAFYGEALDRDRRPINILDIPNMDAAENGDWKFSVFLQFESDGDEYDLRRIAAPKELVSTPRRNSDFEVSVKLTKNSRVVRADEVEHVINQIMPQQVSRFFLFDAELLAEYQDLLADDSEQGRKIKEAIEQVLGVPALVNGRVEIKALLKKAQDVLAKENRHTEGMKAQSEQFERLTGELTSLSEDLTRLRIKEEEYRADLANIELLLAQTEAAQRVQAEVDGLRQERIRLTDRERALNQEKVELVADAWKDLLQPRLRAHIKRLELERDSYQQEIEKRGAIVGQIDQLKTIVEQSTCALCKQPIKAAQRDQFGATLGRLEAELTAMSVNLSRVGDLSGEIAQLASIGASGAAARFRRNEGDLNRIAVDATRIEGALSELQAKIEGFDTAEVARQRGRQAQLNQHIGRLVEEITRTQRETDERVAKQDQLSRMMMRAPGARTQRSAKEVQVYTVLEKLFAKGIEILRERLRNQVATEATKAFLKLTTEKTYSGLQINPNYGLTILDRDNRVVSVRSAGAEQIVALALIDGLNRTSGKVGPVIIDTPLGRLDPKHRVNVLEYVPSMAQQVVLLVHEGEIAKTGGLDILGTKIGAVYDIERLSSSHSRIKKV